MIDLNKTEPAIRVKRARKLLSDSVVWFDTFKKNTQLKRDILDWIRQDQLTAKGIDANENVIGFYSRLTESINPKKQFNTHYTLDDEGDFYRSMFIITLVDSIVIEASSESYREMKFQDWWNDDILNLTEQNLERLRERYKEILINYARELLVVGK